MTGPRIAQPPCDWRIPASLAQVGAAQDGGPPKKWSPRHPGHAMQVHFRAIGGPNVRQIAAIGEMAARLPLSAACLIALRPGLTSSPNHTTAHAAQSHMGGGVGIAPNPWWGWMDIPPLSHHNRKTRLSLQAVPLLRGRRVVDCCWIGHVELKLFEAPGCPMCCLFSFGRRVHGLNLFLFAFSLFHALAVGRVGVGSGSRPACGGISRLTGESLLVGSSKHWGILVREGLLAYSATAAARCMTGAREQGGGS
jgi:hypothetical protein